MMTTSTGQSCQDCGAQNLGTKFCEACGQAATVSVTLPALIGVDAIAPVTGAGAHPQWTPAAVQAAQAIYVARTNTLAVLSLVFALLGGVMLPIIFGHLAKSQIRRTGERGDGLATAGLIIGYLWAVVGIIFVIVALASASRY